MTHRHQITAFVLLLVFIAALLRIGLAVRPGLWVDEIFSLAMATGHSLEHPAADANASLGDYVETVHPRSPSAWRSYMEAGESLTGARRVVRAVFLSDTNPPLYYLLLSAWTRVAGTSDAALRMFSVLAALACFPLLWLLGRYLGGRFAALVACLLFALAPTAIYYSAEGRMYSLAWLLGLTLAWSSVELHRGGSRPGLILLWVLAGAAALLTHYFLAFIWLACLAWLALVLGKSSRPAVLLAAVLSLAVILPWYLYIPESLSQWRVTAGWLDTPLSTRQLLTAPLNLAWSMATPGDRWDATSVRNWLVLLPLTIGFLWALRRGIRPMFIPRRRLPWIWFAAALLGVIAFDLLRGTHAALIPRYALPGLPAAALLGGLVFSRIPRRATAVLLLAICLGWARGGRHMFTEPARGGQPFPEAAAHLDAHTSPEDLIIVHSIPSGVLSVARYLKGGTPVVSWVERLGIRRVPEDLELITSGVCKVALVKVHYLGVPSSAEPWLRTNARLVGEKRFGWDIHLLYFQLTPAAREPDSDCWRSRSAVYPPLSSLPGACTPAAGATCHAPNAIGQYHVPYRDLERERRACSSG